MATYNLIYNTTYDTCPEVQQDVEQITAAMLPSLSHTNYQFDGWYYDQAYENQVEVGDTLEQDTIIFAKWTSGNVYYARMNTHLIGQVTGNTSAEITYDTYEIPSPTPISETVQLNTDGTILRDYIKIDNVSIGDKDKLFRGNVLINAEQFIDSPIIGIMDTDIYVLDSKNNPGEEIEIQANQITIGDMYKINNHLTNVLVLPDQYTYASRSIDTEITYVADTHQYPYQLPSEITVTNAQYEWDSISGKLIIKQPTGVVDVTIVAYLGTHSGGTN